MDRIKSAQRRMRRVWSACAAVAFATVLAGTAWAQAPAAAGAASQAPPAEELAKLVGPIALYPDDLVAIVLPASTSPLQIVQADRYLEKRKADPKLPIDDKWDDPVKSLLNYPDIVKMMSNDLDWTSALGEAVVSDQGAVLEAVQAFRRKAKAAGNLKTDDKQVVKSQQETIIIEPANPQVIYVPQYNPSTVVVYSSAPVWGYYPTAYPAYYYPYAPGAALAAGVIWGAAIGAAWSGNRYGWGGGNDINVNRNTNVNVGSGNTVNRGGNTVNQGGGRQSGSGSTSWKSNKQPGQVSSSVGKNPPSNRAGDARGGAGASAGGGARASTQPAGGADRGGAGGADRPAAGGGDRAGVGGADRAGAGGADRAGAGGGARASTQPAGGADRGGAGGGYSGRGGGGDSGFGGYNSGRQTQMDSSRGASSRSSMGSSYGGASRSASAGAGRSAPSGGARGGGGGRGGGGRR